jgi:hypothetical protein
MFFLVLCRVISLSSLRLGQSSVHKSGVQRDVSISSLSAAGCVLCYKSSYGSATKSEDLMSCSGPYLFVGIEQFDKSVLDVGALASAATVLTETARMNPRLSNGVYWHLERSCSFGFTAAEHHKKTVAVNSRKSTNSTINDVLWSIDQSTGCSLVERIGKYLMLPAPSTQNTRNHVYNCPGALHRQDDLSQLYLPVDSTCQSFHSNNSSRLKTNPFTMLSQPWLRKTLDRRALTLCCYLRVLTKLPCTLARYKGNFKYYWVRC